MRLGEIAMKKAFIILMLVGFSLLQAIPARTQGALVDFTINPNPMGKSTVISLSFNQPVDIGVNIETETGEVIKTLYWGPVDEYIQLFWDRVGDNGIYTPSGEYLVIVNTQERYTSTKKTLILK
jgi:hypothetical protein